MFVLILGAVLLAVQAIGLQAETISERNEPHSTPQNDNYRYEFCVIARLRNVAVLLPQWIEYHIEMGVDHYFFTDDCSTDNGATSYWTDFYSKEGYVTNIPIMTDAECANHVPDEFRLLEVLYQKTRPLCRWMTQLDPDEYIFPNVDDPLGCEGSFCTHGLKRFLKQSKDPLHRLLLTIMSNEGHLTRPSGLIVDNYFHGDFFTRQLIKSIAQTRFFSRWRWPNYPEGYECTPDMHANCSHALHPQHRNPRFLNTHELGVFTIMVGDSVVQCGQPLHTPFYIRHYQALNWQDHVPLRVKRERSASNTRNGWADDSRHIHAMSVWRSYHTNSSCPLGGERFREVISQRVMRNARERIRAHSKNESILLINMDRWFGGEKLE